MFGLVFDAAAATAAVAFTIAYLKRYGVKHPSVAFGAGLALLTLSHALACAHVSVPAWFQWTLPFADCVAGLIGVTLFIRQGTRNRRVVAANRGRASGGG